MRHRLQNVKAFTLPALALFGALVLVAIPRPGAAQNSCLGFFQDVPTADESGGTITCNDCDPACDQDGVTTANGSCTVKFQACVNKSSGSCQAGTIKKLKVAKSKTISGTLTNPGAGSACGAFTALVKLKNKGKKAGKVHLKLLVKTTDKRTQKGTLNITCNPQPASCPIPTTTTTSSTTTTTVGCADCCGSFSKIKTLNGVPDTSVNVGSVVDDSGATLLDLKSGGLYFGGAGVGVPLPSLVPNTLDDANGFGGTYTKITACSGSSFTISPTGVTDVSGAVHPNRHCSSAGVNNPEYPGKPGCLFGPPLAIPNASSQATSTCVINRVSTSAAGTGKCDGTTTLSLPLASDIYLTGPTDGLVPCPLCNGAGPTCSAGPNAGQPCVPEDSASISAANPTSHDCPPAASAFIGSLPIGFNLSAGTQTATSQDLSAQQFVFFGFCGQQFSPAFQNPPHACTADSQCTTSPFLKCRQRTSGAFGQGPARTITATGAAPGCLTDGAAHPLTLISVFAIPPSFNATVDASADLPGPGATSLPGTTQLLP